MRYSLFVFLILCSFQLGAQNTIEKKISLSTSNEPLKKVLKSIAEQSGMSLAYKRALIKDKFITTSLKDKTVDEALQNVLNETTIGYKIRKNKILLFQRNSEDKASLKYTVSGFVTDSTNGEMLIGANVYDPKKQFGVCTNENGYFSLTLPSDNYSFTISYIGFTRKKILVNLSNNQEINIALANNNKLKKIVIQEDNESENEFLNKTVLTPTTMNSLPSLGGEHDAIRSLQFMPGIKSGTENASGLFVRGGAPEENLILLDGVAVYNPTHLFGFLSIFNSDVLNKVELSKSSFQARYGGRLSSVLNVNMKNGSVKRNSIGVSINPLVSKIMIEGPLKKDKGSFIVSYRRSLTDIYLNKWSVGEENFGTDSNKSRFNFNDFNAKLNYKISKNNRLFLSLYSGSDNFKNQQILTDKNNEWKSNLENGLQYGNQVISFRWQSVLSNKLVSNVTAAYTRYKTTTNVLSNTEYLADINAYGYDQAATIDDRMMNADLNYFASPYHSIRFGAGYTNHSFITENGSFTQDRVRESALNNLNANEINIYMEDEWQKNKFQANVGLRLTSYNVNGKTYTTLQPRIAVEYALHPKFKINASYAQMAQFLHLLTNSNVGLPTDLWILPTEDIKPQMGQQIASSITYKPNKKWKLSAEAYYKKMRQLIAYREGASYAQNSITASEKITTGQGEAKGIELFVQRKKGKTTGWLGYTLSETTRQFEEINNGEVFPYKFDHRHDFSIVLMHAFTSNFNISSSWVYTSGGTMSIPTNQYATNINAENINQFSNPNNIFFGQRNNYRMRDYHRLDISLNYTRPTTWGEHSLHLNVYNVYNRFNTVYISRNLEVENDQLIEQYKENALFPIMPSIGYKIKLYGKAK